MDRSYRLKMEAQLNDNILAEEILINCCKKLGKKISRVAYNLEQSKKWIYSYDDTSDDTKMKFNEMIEYRKPFINVLMHDYGLTLDDIKNKVSKAKEKNMPTQEVCDRIREMIVNGSYECMCLRHNICSAPEGRCYTNS